MSDTEEGREARQGRQREAPDSRLLHASSGSSSDSDGLDGRSDRAPVVKRSDQGPESASSESASGCGAAAVGGRRGSLVASEVPSGVFDENERPLEALDGTKRDWILTAVGHVNDGEEDEEGPTEGERGIRFSPPLSLDGGLSDEQAEKEAVLGSTESILEDEQLQKKPKQTTSGMVASVVNLTNTVIGGGTLAVPFAYAAGGFVVSSSLLFAMCGMHIFSCLLLCRLNRDTGIDSYKGLARKAARTRFAADVVDLTIFVSTYGVLVGYNVIIGDLFPPVVTVILGEDYSSHGFGRFLTNRAFLMSIYAFVFMLPLFCLKNLSALRYTSLLAMMAIAYLVVVVAIRSDDYNVGGDPQWANVSTDVFLSLPIITFAYTCQFNVLPIYKELKNRNTPKMNTVVWLSMLICLMVYFVVGMFGYITFVDTVNGNILINYEIDDGFVIAGRVAVSFTITFSYPVIGFSCRQSIMNVLFKKRPMKYARTRWYSLTLMILVTALIIGILVPDIAIVFDLVGATASFVVIISSCVCYIYPGLMYLLIAKRAWYSPMMHMAGFMTVFGIVTFFVCPAVVIWHRVA